MTDRTSVPDSPSAFHLETDSYCIEAVNEALTGERSESFPDGDGGSGSTRDDRRPFDFRLTCGTVAPGATATVLELFASYLAAASHEHCRTVDAPLAVERVTVEGQVTTGTEAETRLESAVTAVVATVHVTTTAEGPVLDRWRRTLRDAEATQAAVPTGVAVDVVTARVAR